MSDPLKKLLQGMVAAMHLLNKAIDKRSALECIVLQSNIIDGALRVGLILKAQLDSGTNEIDDSLLKQAETDPKMPERAIFQRCLANGVIDTTLFDTLTALYEKRNRCIHRYLLTDIDYDYATSLVFDLDAALKAVNDAIYRLEREQIEKSVGMTTSGPEATTEYLKQFAANKEKLHNLDD